MAAIRMSNEGRCFGFIAFPLILTILFAGAAPVQAETLEDVLAATYATNPGLQALRAQLKGVDETVRQARAGWLPTVSVTSNTGRGHYLANTQTSYETNRTPRDASGTISQPIYTGGQTIAGIDQAENNVLATRAQLVTTEQNVLLGAATAFLDIVRDEAVVNLATNHVRILRREVESARVRFAAHEVTQTDVGQAEARLAQAEADLTQAEGSLQDSRATFGDVVGRPPEAPKAPEASWPTPGNFDEIRDIVEKDNPALVAAHYTLVAAKAGVNVAEGQLLPTVSLNGTYGNYLSESTQESLSTTKQIMLTVNVPLYDGGANYSRVRAQKDTVAQRRKEGEQARRDALQNAAKSWQGLRSARARVKSFTTQIRSNETALKGVIEEQRIGSRTVLDVLNAEQELFTAQQNLVTARHDEMVGAFQVASSLGRMTAKALNISVPLYDPTAHYNDVRGKLLGVGSTEE